jgi:hypothetical protein
VDTGQRASALTPLPSGASPVMMGGLMVISRPEFFALRISLASATSAGSAQHSSRISVVTVRPWSPTRARLPTCHCFLALCSAVVSSV